MTHSPESVDSDTFVLSIRGLRIAARSTGSGDPLLLLNGLSRPMKSWTDFAGALRGRTVITLDGPGVGASELRSSRTRCRCCRISLRGSSMQSASRKRTSSGSPTAA